MKSSLKSKIRNKIFTIGSWISFGFVQTCEIMAKERFDWLVIDMEHTTISENDCLSLIQIIESNGTTPLVRVGENNPLIIKKVLDAGAHGIIVPMINTVEDARKAINSIFYPPIGSRGVGLGRAQGYGINFSSYFKKIQEEVIFIPQIEHFSAVDNLEEILDLHEVDTFLVGPYDLSGSLGFPGDWNHPSVKKYLKKIENVISKNKKTGGFHIVHPDEKLLEDKIKKGYKFIAYGDDMVFFAEKIKFELDNIKIENKKN